MLDENRTQSPGFIQDLIGPQAAASGPVQRFLGWPLEWRVTASVALLAAVLILPYLGAVGLWDPWESHYGEVGRMMLVRNDFVRPYWESSWFFSKPPLTMWLDVIGMWIAGTNTTPNEVSRMTEWAMRLPFGLMAIGTLVLLAYALTRTVGARVALATAFALGTMPMFFLEARQTVTDTPFVCTLVAAMSCALIGLFDEKTKARSAWWFAFYVLLGLGTLAKELLAVALPAAVLLLFAGLCVMPWDSKGLDAHLQWLLDGDVRAQVREGKLPMPVLFEQMYRMRLGTGLIIFFCVAAPWLLSMIYLNPGIDDEAERFVYRYFIHDQFARLTKGVHTTTPFTNFVYFIEQGGYAIFPWVAAVPGALAVAAGFRLRDGDKESRVGVFAVVWLLVTFVLLGTSATKFHHYVFPMLPPLAILIGLFVQRLWREGVGRHAVVILVGAALFTLVANDLTVSPSVRDPDPTPAPQERLQGGMKVFTDLFVYNYDRPYPLRVVDDPLTFVGGKPVMAGDLIAVALFLVGAYLFFDSLGKGAAGVANRALGIWLALLGLVPAIVISGKVPKVPPTLWVGLVTTAGAAIWVVLARLDSDAREQSSPIQGIVLAVTGLALCAFGAVRLSHGLVGAADPLYLPLTRVLNLRSALGLAFLGCGALVLAAAARQSRVMLFGSFGAAVVAFALWFSWSHWVDLSHQWTQRDLFWRYYEKRQPGEPIAAFLMNWRGETFYSRNTVKQIRQSNKMQEYLRLPGRKWSLVEQGPRTQMLQQLAGRRPFQIYDLGLNVKFVIVSID